VQARTTTWRGGREVESRETKGGDGEENEGLGLAWVGWGWPVWWWVGVFAKK
jgi:hypothetical protein